MNKVDLHVHTNKSDGTNTPSEILIKAEELGLERIAITDHETVAAYTEVIGNRHLFSGTIVPGIELKTICKGREIELLGFGISIEDMKKNLPLFYKSKEKINRGYLSAIIKVLKERGIILPKDIERQYTGGSQPSWFIRKVIFEDEENLEENMRKFYDDRIGHINKTALYRDWFSNPQSNFYVEYHGYPSYDKAIELIKMCHGKVFIPHIFQYGEISKEILAEMLQTGEIDGIECYYPTFSLEQTQDLLNVCKDKNLLISGGSDFHGTAKKNELGKGLNNNLNIPITKVFEWTEKLKIK